MQLLELFAVAALVAMTTVLLRRPLAGVRRRSTLAFQVGIGLIAGVIAAVLVTVLGTDLVPDEIEQRARPLLFAAVVLASVLLVRRELG